jgi:hypothetical protein
MGMRKAVAGGQLRKEGTRQIDGRPNKWFAGKAVPVKENIGTWTPVSQGPATLTATMVSTSPVGGNCRPTEDVTVT